VCEVLDFKLWFSSKHQVKLTLKSWS
jgi:hypothetical protein